MMIMIEIILLYGLCQVLILCQRWFQDSVQQCGGFTGEALSHVPRADWAWLRMCTDDVQAL